MTLPLFEQGDRYVLASGIETNWRINAEALRDESISTIAYVLAQWLDFDYNKVESIPRGGDRLAIAMREFGDVGSDKTLICDDVLTSGGSMERARRGRQDIVGAVIFARGPIPEYVTAMFITQEAHDIAWHGPL